MKLWTLAPRDSQQKAIKAIRGHRWPYRPEKQTYPDRSCKSQACCQLSVGEVTEEKQNPEEGKR
jgi:hypothetical protein